ncbi:MAG: type II toxin-antitoxin system death-on-curing family toxin [Exilibacterium sp.]
MRYLTWKDVVAIHDDILESHELQGMAQHKSIEAIIARIDNRLQYGMVADIFELAACYASYIAVGYAFNDGNKRTAFATMDICLTLSGIELGYDTEEVGNKIIKAAQGIIDEAELADWLRSQAV